ncbi:Dabb family protein [Mycobacterium intracellulare subsp. intracellulare]|uniref:Dabb family protein n=1 Tax=Mycobacterium avium complex (MAC) TaxID=120793 RepID=UPI0001B45BA5|nr:MULTISPECIES: Dabb family protein [Mycobacterium avium complex (MAC)]UGU08663.1 Dabb family protein [Mycobacterium intracellulare subsp. intracellulare]BCO57764.1 stress responsive protein [Mycobacterium intracellulare]BCO94929.1 stress responsive protein [Mycobacterium intracellulare]
MYNLTRLIDVAEADRDRILDELRAAARAAAPLRWVVQPTLPGSRNGGDILVHLRFATAHQCARATEALAAVLADPAVVRVNGASYAGSPVRCGETAGTVYRTLLLRVQPGTSEPTLARFERELSSMPRYLPTIRAWQLSRVSAPVGTCSWTHVFEQEFADVEALTGPYLMHPVHWAVVDRWFDPETTDVIIRDRVCHSFCAIPDPVLS